MNHAIIARALAHASRETPCRAIPNPHPAILQRTRTARKNLADALRAALAHCAAEKRIARSLEARGTPPGRRIDYYAAKKLSEASKPSATGYERSTLGRKERDERTKRRKMEKMASALENNVYI